MDEFCLVFNGYINSFKDIRKIKVSGAVELVGTPIGESKLCFEKIIDKQAFHQSIEFSKLLDFLFEQLSQKGNSITVFSADYIFSFKKSKNGKLLHNKAPNTQKQTNQQKFLLPLDTPVFFRLGVVTEDGKLIPKMRAKYEQISRFCELVVDTIGSLKTIRIVDCGCGKAYLTFALYHYLSTVLGIDTHIHGTDLKSAVITELKKLADEYGYTGLTFSNADIKKLDLSPFDMMISLHACDMATDFAIENAVRGGVKMILCVPCCQQEMNKSFFNGDFTLFSRYGLIKERVSALMTDAVRASMLTSQGYKVKVVEFVDFEHSPKNIMIKATKSNLPQSQKTQAKEEVEKFLSCFTNSYRNK